MRACVCVDVCVGMPTEVFEQAFEVQSSMSECVLEDFYPESCRAATLRPGDKETEGVWEITEIPVYLLQLT